MSACPCGSAKAYNDCCGPLIDDGKIADTAENLMRSRYTAYTRSAIDYLLKTTHPGKTEDHDPDAMRKWAEESQWHGLEIISTEAGGPEDETGQVEFIARYTENGDKQEHHEIAEFKKQDGQWFFFDGQAPRPATYVRQDTENRPQ